MFDSFTSEKFKNREFCSLDNRNLVNLSQIPNLKKEKKIILISGPTGVGKSDFAEFLVAHMNGVIINGDMGQIYTPISIGTAKPENTNNCYLFNIMNQPLDLSAHTFRNMVIKSLNECWAAGKVPIIVGGSGFYIKSLFYSLASFSINEDEDKEIMVDFSKYSTEELYLKLENIDSERAKSIHPNDRYRIERALFLWKKTFYRPSDLEPKFEPLGSCFYYFLTRDRHELRNRIDERVGKMLKAGWIYEVKQLDYNWKTFLLKKKLIGYPEIIQYLEEKKSDLEDLTKIIGCKTAQYAKRQFTFWRSLKKQLIESDPYNKYIKDIQEFDLTNNFGYLRDIIIKKINES